MRAYVFTDKALAGQAGRFVWLAINTEKASNGAVEGKLKVLALPTFFVLNPADESVALRWVGGASVPQLVRILDEGRAIVASGAVTDTLVAEGATADQAMAVADKLYASGDNAHSAVAFREALRRAPPNWPAYSRALESVLFALSLSDSNETVARMASDEFPKFRRTASAGNIAASGLGAALALPAEHPRRAEWSRELEAAVKGVLADSAQHLVPDDRTALYEALISAYEDRKDSTGAHALREELASFLDSAAAHARTPFERTSLDPNRLGVFMELNRYDLAAAMLQQSERDFPEDYNPPARLAVALKALKRWKEALAASDRAMSLAYGPRKQNFYLTRSDIFVGLGDVPSARRTMEEAIRYAESLPAGQRSNGRIASFKKKLESLQSPPAPNN